MKLLKITVEGLPIFESPLILDFYATDNVTTPYKNTLFNFYKTYYLNPVTVLTGKNASGKTSTLKVVEFVAALLNNDQIGDYEKFPIIKGSESIVFDIVFLAADKVCRLVTEIDASESVAYIKKEKLYEKNLSDIKKKKDICSFENLSPIMTREDDDFLLQDVSIMVAYNKRRKQKLDVISLLDYTNKNVPLFNVDVPLPIIEFLDDGIEYIRINNIGDHETIELKFVRGEKILLNKKEDLVKYLSSGTIKGITVFIKIKEVLDKGSILLIDELENHFNAEIVKTIIRFFLDGSLNQNGGMIVLTTHYAQLLDEVNRKDCIYICENTSKIRLKKLADVMKRNDIKRSAAYESGLVGNTNPSYEKYIALKRTFDVSYSHD